MDFSNFFHESFYRPIFNVLMAFYVFSPIKDFGLAIIALTVLTRLLFYPLSKQAAYSQRLMAKIQPQLKEIQERYKNNKEEQTKAMMSFYKDKKINPLSGCVPILIQLPVLFALFAVFQNGLNPEALKDLYSYNPNPGTINVKAFGFIDLAQKTPIIMALMAGGAQYLQSVIMLSVMPKKDKSESGGKMDMNQMLAFQTKYFFPVFTTILAINFPAGLGLYLLATTLVSIIQQVFINRSLAKDPALA